MTALAMLQGAPNAETVGPGLAGFLAIFGIALATVLLLRSMVGHLRKVRYSPDPADQDGQDSSAGPPSTSARARSASHDAPDDSPGRDV